MKLLFLLSGWKTNVAGYGLIIWGIVGFFAGAHDANEMGALVANGLGFLGIGHKIEKQ